MTSSAEAMSPQPGQTWTTRYGLVQILKVEKDRVLIQAMHGAARKRWRDLADFGTTAARVQPLGRLA